MSRALARCLVQVDATAFPDAETDTEPVSHSVVPQRSGFSELRARTDSSRPGALGGGASPRPISVPPASACSRVIEIGRGSATSTHVDGESRLRIVGALDALTLCDLGAFIESVLADHPRLVTVELDKVTLIDSHGVGALVSLLKRVRADGGNAVIVGAHDQPRAVLKILNLERIFGL